mgnify:CR=1 FL=1
MNKKILYLDMDGVVADFEKKIGELQPEIKDFKSFEDINELSEKIDLVCYANPEIYHDLPPVPGAIEAVKKLYEIYEVYFLSTAMWSLPASFTGKRMWIEKHFGDLGKKKLILTHRKDLMRGDFLVDDRTHNGAGQFEGELLLFGSEKFPDWEVTLKYLIEVEKLSNSSSG